MNVCINQLTRFYINDYDRINFCEGIDVNKASASREFIICHYWCFLEKWFRIQSSVCNWCHDPIMMSFDINSIAILNIHTVDCCIIFGISKSQVMNLLKNADLSEKSGSL